MITRKQRLLSGFVAVLMLISLFTAFVLPVSADGEFPVYNANAETYFNTTADYNAPRGSQYATYSSSTIFVVADAADWRGLVAAGAAAKNLTIHLVADIDMGNVHVDPLMGYVGGTANSFSGTLNGHGHVFKNLVIMKNVNDATLSYHALIGRADNATIRELGIESGLIRPYGSTKLSASSGEIFVAGFAGEAVGTTKFINCWNGATVSSESYTYYESETWKNGSNTTSGIARLQNTSYFEGCYNIGMVSAQGTGYAGGLSGYINANEGVNVYNSFGAGSMDGATSTLIRSNGSNSANDDAYNTYLATGDGGDYYNSAAPGDQTTMAAYILGADAYHTGELAWNMNDGADTTTGHTTYWTVKDGKTVFGTEMNQTRKVTFTDGTNTAVHYYNAGTVVDLPAATTYTVTGAAIEGTKLTVGTTDATVTFADTGLVPLFDLYEEYSAKGNFFKTADGTKTVADLLVEAEALFANADANAITALVEAFNGMVYRGYPNAPKASEYKLYTDAPDFLVEDIADLNAAAAERRRFTKEQTLHFTADEIVVTPSDTANSFRTTNVAFEGHGVTIKGITVTGINHNAEVTGHGWLGVYNGYGLKDFTFKDCSVTNSGWQGAFLIGSNDSADLKLTNLTFDNCSVTTGGQNGMSIVLGYQNGTSKATLTNITIKNCTMDRKTNSGNSGFLTGRVANGTYVAQNVYLVNNTITGNMNANGCGILMGQTTGANITVKNAGIFNTTIAQGGAYGVLTGSLKVETASAHTYTVDNVISYNNGTAPVIYKENDTAVTESITNVFADTGIYSNMGTITTPANETADSVASGEAAWNANQADSVEQLWKMENNLPVFADAATATQRFVAVKEQIDGSYKDDYLYYNGGAAVALPTADAYELVESTVPEFATYEDNVLSFTMPTEEVTVTYDLVGADFTYMNEIKAKYAPYADKFDLFTQGAAMEAAYEAALAALEYEGDEETDLQTIYAAITAAEDLEEAVTEIKLNDTFTSETDYSAPNGKDYALFNATFAPTNWIVADAADWRALVDASLATTPDTFAGKTIHLVKNIDMNNENVEPMGGIDEAGTYRFKGTLDGHGFAFQNLKIHKTITSTATTRVGLIGHGQCTVKNLGIESGSIYVDGSGSGLGETLAGAIMGQGEGGTKVINCWNGASVNTVAYGGNDTTSGIARLQETNSVIDGCYNIGAITAGTNAGGIAGYTQSKVYNSFSAGELLGGACLVRLPGQDLAASRNVLNNWLASDNENANFSWNVSTDMADHKIAASTYTTGELAWLLNSNAEPTATVTTYYTMKDGKTVFGTAANQTRKVTLKAEGASDQVAYYNSGAPITLNYAANVASYEVTEGNANLVDGVLTLAGEDVTVTVTLAGANKSELQAYYDEYSAKGNYFETAEGKEVATLVDEAKEVLDDTSADQNAVNAVVAEFATLKYRAYPHLPKASEIGTYSDAVNFLIDSIDEMNYVAENGADFKATKVLHFAIEGDEITVPDGAAANSWNSVNASIDGHGVTIIGVDYVGTSTDRQDGWLGQYAGAYLKNITFKNWTATNLAWQGALIVAYTKADTAFENLHFIDCTATKGRSNGLGMLIGIQEETHALTFKNITFTGCTLDMKDLDAGNSAFLIGRLQKGTMTAEKIYLNNNKYISTGTKFGSGRGLVIGECTGTSATFTDVGVFNTTYEGTAIIHGIIGGMVKNGQTAVYKNIITGNNGTYPMVMHGTNDGGTVVAITFNDVYSDANYIVSGSLATQAGQVIEGNITTEQAMYGYAAAKLNAVEGAAKWEILPEATAPSFDEDGLGLPVEVEFDAYDIESNELESTYTLYTDTTGRLLNVESVIDKAEWLNENDLETMTFTQKQYEVGYVAPASHTEHTWDYSEQNDEADTHTQSCNASWTKDNVTVTCDEVQTGVGCTFTNYSTDDAAAAPNAAAHKAACACGNTHTVLCSEGGESWLVESEDATCDTPSTVVYNCTVCGYTHEELGTVREHDFSGDWTYDAENHKHYKECAYDDCAVTQSEDCTYGAWSVVTEPTTETTGLKERTCSVCGGVDSEVIPNDASIGIKLSQEAAVSGDVIYAGIGVNSNPGVAGGTLTVTYNANALTLTGSSSMSGVYAELGVPSAADENGYVTVEIAFASAANITTSDAIVTLNFTVNEGFEKGDYTIAVAVDEMIDKYTQIVGVAGSETTVYLTDMIYGDITGDGKVSIADAVLVLRYVCGAIDGFDWDSVRLDCADVTGDNEVLTDDVIRILRFINGKVSSLEPVESL